MDLVQIDSPTGEEDAMDQEVSNRLEALGFSVYHDSFKNVIANMSGIGETLIIFLATPAGQALLTAISTGVGIKGYFDKKKETKTRIKLLNEIKQLIKSNVLAPSQFIAAGRGEFIPLASNSTLEGRAANRRIEIILSPKLENLLELLEE